MSPAEGNDHGPPQPQVSRDPHREVTDVRNTIYAGDSEPPADTEVERAIRFLREAILQGDYKPGQRLPQKELTEQLDMSPTPIREALRLLEAQGLLERVPYKGAFVAEASPDESEEISVIRSALEGLATKMAVPNLTAEDIAHLDSLVGQMEDAWRQMSIGRLRRSNYRFHSLIYRKAGSQRLSDMIISLWPRFATDSLWMIPGRAERSIQQHHALLDRIRAGDAEAAADLMSDHIHTAGKSIAKFLRAQQSGQRTQRSNIK
jgi:DNA-binding GntR family transcriptional regulator